MSLTLPYPTLGTGVTDSTKIDSNNSTIAAKFGNIDNSDVKSGAGLDINKLSASYEYVVVPLNYAIVGAGGMPAAATILAATPMYNDTKGTWTAVAYSWFCTDIGAQTGKINIKWGCYTAAGAISAVGGNPVTIVSGELLNGGTNNTPYQDGATVSVSLPWNQANMILYMDVNTQDATALSADGDRIVATVLLKRQITT